MVAFYPSDSSRTVDEQQSDYRRIAVCGLVELLFADGQTTVQLWTYFKISLSFYSFWFLKGEVPSTNELQKNENKSIVFA